MHEAAKNKREADANRARLEAEIKMTESMVENDLNNERRKKLQEKQRVRRQVEDEITKLTSELFSKKVRGVGYDRVQHEIFGWCRVHTNPTTRCWQHVYISKYVCTWRSPSKAFGTERVREPNVSQATQLISHALPKRVAVALVEPALRRSRVAIPDSAKA